MTEARHPARPSGYQRNGTQWANTKQRILTRDHHICYLCRQPGADTVDHVTPVAQGGTHRDNNLAAAHQTPCHKAKTERERLHGIAQRQRRRPTRPDPRLV